MTDPLRTIAIVSLFIGAASALIIAVDLVAGHKQRMWIMNWVWPITALYAGPLGLWGYFTTGRLSTYRVVQEAKARGEDPIFWLMQIAMLAGFLTSYPVNWWLLRAGIKEKM